MHFNLDGSIARTSLATTTLHVERKTTWLITTNLRLRRCCKQLTNRIKNTRVGGWVRTRSTPNRALVHVDHFVNCTETFNSAVSTRCIFTLMQVLHHCGQQNVSDECALAASRNTSHCNKATKRNLYIDVLQVVFTCTTDRYSFTCRSTAYLWNRYGGFTG